MNANWGGKQNKIRDTLIEQEKGFLGPHSPILKAGDTQCMGFDETDEGTYYMDPLSHELRRFNEILVGKK